MKMSFPACKAIALLIALASVNANAEDWITEEVLKQLSEVRQELKILQGEVRGLKEQIIANKNTLTNGNRGKLTLDISDSPTVGESAARIAIVEFSDYQCPYCKRHYSQTLPKIQDELIDTGKVKYVMKQFPLGFHAKAVEPLSPLCVWES